MKSLKIFIFKVLRKILTPNVFKECTDYVDYFDQEANDKIYQMLSDGKPLLMAKFGTTEMDTILSYLFEEQGVMPKIYIEAIKRKACIYPESQLKNLCMNSGFFPNDIELGRKFYKRMMEDIKEVDILASYIQAEKYLQPYMHCQKMNLKGYYAPFLWKHPWTRYLEGKRVLVVHPFVATIKKQYEENRQFLFADKEVLPEFKSIDYVQAVQSLAGEKVPYKDWFEALNYMEQEIDKKDFDVALIGCGAYGFCLAAHVKRLGKQAMHLAGWTQMLFGVYGNRWLNDEPEFSKFINEHWVRPSAAEKPKDAAKIENSCYW